MGVKQHTIGEVRYMTYYLIFPGDEDYWVDQIPFVGDLMFHLRNTGFKNDPLKVRDFLLRGETKWKDQNGVIHRVVLEHTKRNRKWGLEPGQKVKKLLKL